MEKFCRNFSFLCIFLEHYESLRKYIDKNFDKHLEKFCRNFENMKANILKYTDTNFEEHLQNFVEILIFGGNSNYWRKIWENQGNIRKLVDTNFDKPLEMLCRNLIFLWKFLQHWENIRKYLYIDTNFENYLEKFC